MLALSMNDREAFEDLLPDDLAGQRFPRTA
jgi:hypothetical protein